MIQIYTAVPGTWVVTYTYHVEEGRTATRSFQVSGEPDVWQAIARVQVLKGSLPGFRVIRVAPSMVWQGVKDSDADRMIYAARENRAALGATLAEGDDGEEAEG